MQEALAAIKRQRLEYVRQAGRGVLQEHELDLLLRENRDKETEQKRRLEELQAEDAQARLRVVAIDQVRTVLEELRERRLTTV